MQINFLLALVAYLRGEGHKKLSPNHQLHQQQGDTTASYLH